MQNESGKYREKDEKGFSLIEAVVAIFIITIGLLGMAAAVTYALEYGMVSRNVSRAKLVITSSFEEIESIRNSQQLDFKQIANVGSVDNTDTPNTFDGFSTGYKEISSNPGADGVNGTDDDLINKGADSIYGTADDFNDASLVVSGYVREIIITNLNPTLKKIQVNVRYYGANGKIGTLSGISYLNNESRLTR